MYVLPILTESTERTKKKTTESWIFISTGVISPGQLRGPSR